MKKSRFSETQIVSILKEADAGRTVQDICREHGISASTYYQRLKKLVADQALDMSILKEVNRGNF